MMSWGGYRTGVGEDVKKRVVKLRKQGCSYKLIINRLGISRVTIAKILREKAPELITWQQRTEYDTDHEDQRGKRKARNKMSEQAGSRESVWAFSSYRIEAEGEINGVRERWIVVSEGSRRRALELLHHMSNVFGAENVTLDYKGKRYSAAEGEMVP